MSRVERALLAAVIVSFLLLALAWGIAFAQGPGVCPGPNSTLSPAGFQQLTVDGSQAFSLTVPTNAWLAVMIPQGSVTYLDTGASPTTSNGMTVQANTVLVVCRGSLPTFRVIAGSSTTVPVLFYK